MLIFLFWCQWCVGCGDTEGFYYQALLGLAITANAIGLLIVLTKKNAYNIGILDNDDHVERILLKNHLHNDVRKKKYSKNCEWCHLSLLIGGLHNEY